MAKIIVSIVFVVVLLIFNPGVDAHREALLPYVQKSFNKAYQDSGLVGKIGFVLVGDDIKEALINSIYRKSYGICSMCYADGKVVTFGILGYVHVLE